MMVIRQIKDAKVLVRAVLHLTANLVAFVVQMLPSLSYVSTQTAMDGAIQGFILLSITGRTCYWINVVGACRMYTG